MSGTVATTGVCSASAYLLWKVSDRKSDSSTQDRKTALRVSKSKERERERESESERTAFSHAKENSQRALTPAVLCKC